MNVMKWLNEKFLKIADAVSFGMGTPTNIFFWLLAVIVWFGLGLTRPRLFADANFLPEWFTSPAWNFPLNTITTLAELYIGFLVAAATNRAERRLREIIEGIKNTVEKVERINSKQNEILDLLVEYQEKELKQEGKTLNEIKSVKKTVIKNL